MYVNKSKMMLALGAVNVKIKIWAVLCGMSLMAFAGSFLPEMKEKYGIGPSTFVGLGLAAAFGLLMYANVNKRKKLNLAYRLSNVFENDSDGIMMTNEIANAVHMLTPQLEQTLLWLLNNNYLINCRFDDKNQSRIILSDVNNAATQEFVLITCKACGTQIQARPGQGIKCPSCGTFIAPQ